jgi:hypothetical protein
MGQRGRERQPDGETVGLPRVDGRIAHGPSVPTAAHFIRADLAGAPVAASRPCVTGGCRVQVRA